MSRCFGCASKFGLFRKEHACKGCGKSFCSSCLSHKLVIEKFGSTEQSVCRSCFQTVNRNRSEPPPPYPGPPAKETESSNVCQMTKSEASTTTTSFSAVAAAATADPEAAIRERLAKLKERDKDASSSGQKMTDQEIGDRFANLTGRVPQCMQKGNILTPQPKLSEQEEINKLFQQVTEEVGLDSKDEDDTGQAQMSDKDLETRLLKLKGIDPASVNKSTEDFDSSEDEAEAVANIIKKALEEDRLDEKVKQSGYGHLLEGTMTEKDIRRKDLPAVPQSALSRPWKPSEPESDEDDELPWCCICNADAAVRCHGCDDDLYCKRCYREGHSREDFEYHQTSPFRKKKNGS